MDQIFIMVQEIIFLAVGIIGIIYASLATYQLRGGALAKIGLVITAAIVVLEGFALAVDFHLSVLADPVFEGLIEDWVLTIALALLTLAMYFAYKLFKPKD